MLDKLREGTEPERNLVIMVERGLSGSLGLILKSRNMFCRQVIFSLLEETDRRSRW